jgi:hypothetical protein
MQRQWKIVVAGSLVVGAVIAGPTWAAPPWSTLLPFKRIEADPNKDYLLTQEHGPWLVMCRSFAGETADQEAHALVLELREKFKLKAYVHKQTYDFTKPEVGRGYNKFGGPKLMVPQNGAKFEEIAVLVGNFETVDDPKAQDALEKIKYARPACLEIDGQKNTSQRYAGWRNIVQRINPDSDRNIKDKGPMRMAFVTRNPLLPDEYFAPQGLDKFVIELNEDVEYSLLKNRGVYTVRIASFQGDTTMKLDEIEEKERSSVKHSKLEQGAINAHKIVMALREQGVDAYEFHDRHESIVTVGSFESIGEPREDGRIEIDPRVKAVMDRFGAKQLQLPGQYATGLSPQKVAGISLDIQPTPVKVPRQSIGAVYARRPLE